VPCGCRVPPGTGFSTDGRVGEAELGVVTAAGRVDLSSLRDHSHRVRATRGCIEFFTVGYEGRTLDEFIALLKRARVERIVDVRELPLSRRRGFSKTPLSDALAKHGIDYVHVRAAGNPHRDLRHDIKKCLAAYREHLRENPGAVDEVMRAIEGRRAALLCVEHEPTCCHRSVLAARLVRRRNVEVAAHL
jgi:uncharacterized protein (DUF488 family)